MPVSEQINIALVESKWDRFSFNPVIFNWNFSTHLVTLIRFQMAAHEVN